MSGLAILTRASVPSGMVMVMMIVPVPVPGSGCRTGRG
jgi:hypothetical protein